MTSLLGDSRLRASWLPKAGDNTPTNVAACAKQVIRCCISPLQEIPLVDFTSWNDYADPDFRFYDQDFLEKCREKNEVCLGCEHWIYLYNNLCSQVPT